MVAIALAILIATRLFLPSLLSTNLTCSQWLVGASPAVGLSVVVAV